MNPEGKKDIGDQKRRERDAWREQRGQTERRSRTQHRVGDGGCALMPCPWM